MLIPFQIYRNRRHTCFIFVVFFSLLLDPYGQRWWPFVLVDLSINRLRLQHIRSYEIIEIIVNDSSVMLYLKFKWRSYIGPMHKYDRLCVNGWNVRNQSIQMNYYLLGSYFSRNILLLAISIQLQNNTSIDIWIEVPECLVIDSQTSPLAIQAITSLLPWLFHPKPFDGR